MSPKLRRRLKISAAVLAGLFLIAVIVVLLPGFQRWVALGQLQKIDPDAALERIHVTPFSAELRGFHLHTPDLTVELADLDARISPWTLPFLHLQVKSANIEGLVLTITPERADKAVDEAQREAEEADFPGLLALSETGFKLSLDNLTANAKLLLPGLEAQGRLTGGGLAPEATGTFHWEPLTLSLPEQEPLRRVTVSGPLHLSQNENGSIDSIAWDLTLVAEGTLFDQEVSIQVSGELTDDGLTSEEVDERRVYPPERVQLVIRETQSPAEAPALLDLEADFDQAMQTFSATFQLAANSASLDPFALALDLPEFRGTGQGELSWSLLEQRGRSSMTFQASLSKLERLSEVLVGVGQLELQERHELTVTPNLVVLESFGLILTAGNQGEVLDLSISNPLSFRLLDADTVLEGLDGTWLALQVDMPLDWFDPLLGGFELKGADLSGQLLFTGNPLHKLAVTAPKPLQVGGTSLYRDGALLLQDVAMQLTPGVELAPDHISAHVSDLRIRSRDLDMLVGQAGAQLDLTAKEGFRATLSGEMEGFMHGLVNQQIDEDQQAGRNPVYAAAQRRILAANEAIGESSLKMSFQGSAVPDRITAEKTSLLLAKKSGEVLADVELASAVTAVFSNDTVAFEGLDGSWLNAAFTGVPVSVPAIFIDAVELSGGTIRGAFTLGANGTEGGFAVNFTEPLTIETLSVVQEAQPLLRNVDVHVQAALDYVPGRASLSVSDFQTTVAGSPLASGTLDAEVALKQFHPERIDFTLAGQAGLRAVLAQPPAETLLKQPLSEELTVTWATSGQTELQSLQLAELRAGLQTVSGHSLVSAVASEPLVVASFAITDLEQALAAVTGAGSLSIDALPLDLPLLFVEADPWHIDSGALAGNFNWNLAEGKASLTPQVPLTVNQLSVNQGDAAFLEGISASVTPTLTLTAKEATLDAASIALRADAEAPLSGQMSAIVALDQPMPVQTFSGDLTGPVAAWFRQPLLPPNTLTRGELTAAVRVKPDGTATLNASLDQVSFKDALPYVQSAYIEGSAKLDPEAQRYTGTFPATFETTDGTTDATTDLEFFKKDGLPMISAVVNGKLLRLSDLERVAKDFLDVGGQAGTQLHRRPGVDSLTEAGSREKKTSYEQEAVLQNEAILAETHRHAHPSTEAEEHDDLDEEEEAPPEIDFTKLSEETPEPEIEAIDETPFWAGLPRSTLRFHFDEMAYVGYVRFSDVRAETSVLPERISLDSFAARFHEARIGGKGKLDWDAKATPKPYDLEATSEVSDFDLSAFFGALVPGEKPRVEGLFKMDAHAEGSFPSLDQARNFLTFALNLESSSGVFRAIPPNSQLAQSTSGTAAFFGEVLSYVPTSALGLGTLSRLVGYMREVPYKLVAVNIIRETDLNVRIERLEVRSDQMLILGRGGILYDEHEDLLDQRFDLTAAMDARGEFAAILSGLGLLTDRPAGNNYWRGFDFRIWGSLAKPKTNFDNIVTQASSGTVTRNVTNPLHGIWSNIKYSGEGPPPEAGPPSKMQAEAPAEAQP